MSSLSIFLKGLAMGAADVVPGVSGGTIAFITGIYDPLINALKSFNLQALRTLKQAGIKGFLTHVHAAFLVPLLLGIACAILTLAKGIHYLLLQYPEYVWAFFFGLIIASAGMIGRQITTRGMAQIVALLCGIVIAAAISVATPTAIEPTPLIVFGAGAIAICAMILPGISGSFLLLLMGLYEPIIGAIKSFELLTLGVFGCGAVVGILSFVRVLSFLLQRYHNTMLALLTGFMLGTLFKVWPWKHTVSTRINSHGETVPLVQENVLPMLDEQLIWVMVCLMLGSTVVALLELSAKKSSV